MRYQDAMIEEINYRNDRRVLGGQNKWWEFIDERKMTATVLLPIDDEDRRPDDPPEREAADEELVEVGFEWDVCPTCEGKGSHINPSIDCCGISGERFDDDPGFAEDYRNGTYDVPCYECGGRRVVPSPADERLLKYLEQKARWDAEFRAEVAAELRFGC